LIEEPATVRHATSETHFAFKPSPLLFAYLPLKKTPSKAKIRRFKK
jgi:hypothetical protein